MEQFVSRRLDEPVADGVLSQVTKSHGQQYPIATGQLGRPLQGRGIERGWCEDGGVTTSGRSIWSSACDQFCLSVARSFVGTTTCPPPIMWLNCGAVRGS